MTGAWPARVVAGAEGALGGLGGVFGRPPVQRGLRLAAAALLALWVLHSLVTALWSLVPTVENAAPTGIPINPAMSSANAGPARTVDIDVLLAADLFGAADPAALAAAAQAEPLIASRADEMPGGIEDSAPETSLPLLLMGVAAADDPALTQAVIEHRGEQARYRIGDELPGGGRVILAKVLPTQVVLDNGGRFELLKLFDGDGQLADASRAIAPSAARRAAAIPTGNPGEIAAVYRERLYSDPESLSELVTISGVRVDGELIGYRLQPGVAAEAFTALGFRSGDLVTAVNGLPLTDPANAVRLYNDARGLDSAVFELRRGDEELTVTVTLDGEQ